MLPDELSVFFITRQARDTYGSLWLATRDHPIDDFREPDQLLAGVPADSPSITADALNLYYIGTDGIYVAARTSTADDFGRPRLLSELAAYAPVAPRAAPLEVPDTESDDSVSVTPDGKTLYFSGPQGAFQVDVGEGTVAALFSLNLSGSSSPVVSADGLTLYFSRPDDCGNGSVWEAHRAIVSDPFGFAAPVSQKLPTCDTNAPHFSFTSMVPIWVSANGCRLYTRQCSSSHGAGSVGDVNCRDFLATRPAAN